MNQTSVKELAKELRARKVWEKVEAMLNGAGAGGGTNTDWLSAPPALTQKMSIATSSY